jgi:hypothetical protein
MLLKELLNKCVNLNKLIGIDEAHVVGAHAEEASAEDKYYVLYVTTGVKDLQFTDWLTYRKQTRTWITSVVSGVNLNAHIEEQINRVHKLGLQLEALEVTSFDQEFLNEWLEVELDKSISWNQKLPEFRRSCPNALKHTLYRSSNFTQYKHVCKEHYLNTTQASADTKDRTNESE